MASGLTSREYTFTPGSREQEGTWTYRVSEANESGESAPSAVSEAIKVDRTAPFTPTATATRAPDYAGKGGWYKNSVTVSFAANGDPVLADGSAGSGVEPASLTEPETFTASGAHTASGTVADKAGNVSARPLVVQVESTPPNLEISCPSQVYVGEAGVNATVVAGDVYPGCLAIRAAPCQSTRASPNRRRSPAPRCRTWGSKRRSPARLRSCTDPRAPALTAGATPNHSGLFTLGWTGDNPLTYMGLGYTLQAHDASTTEWTTVANEIEALSYAFTGAGESEGTWVYRVQGVDSTHSQSTAYSAASAPVVVDTTAPDAPTAAPTRGPDYAGGGGWSRTA